MTAVEIVIAVLVLSGVAFTLLAAIGLQQFPDVFARMHCATKPATLGLMLVLIGGMLALGDPRSVAKLTLVAILQLLNAPVGAHMIGRSAWWSGNEVAPGTWIDPLAEEYLGERRQGAEQLPR